MPDDTPRVPAHSDPGRPRVGRDQRSRRVRALARLAAMGATVDLGRIGAGTRRRNRLTAAERERIAYADIELDVARGKA
ncbi:hypothetical protein LCGC14_0935290 [marine sediment metagenome]|uniref:Uncharacterized protein n=1 Tax=marine sediment metagenome TaxID=412755 RepID=A0A0F9RT47_9ZZZZ